jgi:FkbM family methyltransferase
MNIVQIGTCVGNDDLTKIIGKKEPNKLILVEPLSIHNNDIEKCYNWVKNHYIENVAITLKTDEYIKFYYHNLNGLEYVLSSTSIEHILKHNYKIDGIVELNVKTMTINDLFDKYELNNIDILFIDSEGLDDQIIKSINFEKYNIKQIYFENLHLSQIDIYDYLIKNGYFIKKKIGENGWTDVATKLNIKLIHILNNIDGEREKISINNLSQLKKIGVDYKQQITPLYDGDLWETPTSSKIIHNSKAHYGLYESYKKAIKENFTEDLDALIICECDSVLNINIENFNSEINKTLEFCNKYDIYQFSWGGRLIDNYEQGIIIDVDNDYPNYVIVNKIIESHFNIFTKQSINFYLNNIDKIKWDSADIWLNELLIKNNKKNKQGVTLNKLAYQQTGLSSLDKKIKGNISLYYNFIIDYNIDNNKIYIKYDNKINVIVNIFEWEKETRNEKLLFSHNSEFNNNKLWYITNKQLKDIDYIKIEIREYNKLIYYRYLKIKKSI